MVVPVFNEEACLPELLTRMEAVADTMAANWALNVRVIAVNDGSSDGSALVLDRWRPVGFTLESLHFRRNFGHQAAVTAGLEASQGDFVAIIDADLQDPPEVLGALAEPVVAGTASLAYGRRIQRDGETWAKRKTAKWFYRAIRGTSGLDVPLDTGDFRVMSGALRDELNALPERSRFMRLQLPWLGHGGVPIDYERAARFAGESKYQWKHMVPLAMHAIISFSTLPVRLMQLLTVLVAVCTVGFAVAGTAVWAIGGDAPLLLLGLAWTSFLSALVLGGISFVIGYTQRVQEEVHRRPRYLIETETVVDPAGYERQQDGR